MRWRDPDWLDEATAWIDARVGESRTGSIEQPHVYPWSTVMRVPTADGALWFKANAPVHVFEAGLSLELARRFPDRVAEIVDADPERGWTLMRDAGARLRDLAPGPEQLVHWERILPLYAELQLALASEAATLLGLGVPDGGLDGLPHRFERLLADEDALLLGQPEGLTADELAALRRVVPSLGTTCTELAAFGVPETLQHDDLHDGQVFVDDALRYRILDWGDSCVTHPFHTLVVTLRVLAWRHGLAPGGGDLLRLRDAYLEPFTSSYPHADLVAAVDLAHRTGTIARALAWHRYLAARPPSERGEDAETVPYGLKMFLARRPIGAWNPG